MEIKYLIDKNQRKAMAEKISEIVGEDVKYLGAPSFAYRIGDFTLNTEAVLSFSNSMDSGIAEMVMEWLDSAGYHAESKNEIFTVAVPKESLDETALENLKRIVANKELLLKHALDTDSLEITETDETIEFEWFTLSNPEDSSAYQQFISMLCDFAKHQKRVNNKPDTSDNEKYAFRCFLLRIGMIGADFKQTRKVLLRNLTGSSAFRYGKPKGEPDHEVSE